MTININHFIAQIHQVIICVKLRAKISCYQYCLHIITHKRRVLTWILILIFIPTMKFQTLRAESKATEEMIAVMQWVRHLASQVKADTHSSIITSTEHIAMREYLINYYIDQLLELLETIILYHHVGHVHHNTKT